MEEPPQILYSDHESGEKSEDSAQNGHAATEHLTSDEEDVPVEVALPPLPNTQ